MKSEEKRLLLKAAGWRRADRASGPNKSTELWHNPSGTSPPQGVSLRAAWTAYLKSKS